MFRGRSAWFSSSVPQARRNFWTLEGGSVAGWRTADYLFSEDATCPDTLRIFESKDYLWKKVVIFHCLFLSVCETRQSVKSVSIGHFVLPPVSVQEDVKNVVGRLIWEREGGRSVAQDSHRSHQTEDEYTEGEVSRLNSVPTDTDSSDGEVHLCGYLQEFPDDNILAGYVSMDKLEKYLGDLCDFCPRCFQCSNCKAHCCLHIRQ